MTLDLMAYIVWSVACVTVGFIVGYFVGNCPGEYAFQEDWDLENAITSAQGMKANLDIKAAKRGGQKKKFPGSKFCIMCKGPFDNKGHSERKYCGRKCYRFDVSRLNKEIKAKNK